MVIAREGRRDCASSIWSSTDLLSQPLAIARALDLVARFFVVVPNAKIEPSVARDPAGSHYQFERTGYFVMDSADSRPDALVFNRTVSLRDSWEKQKNR